MKIALVAPNTRSNNEVKEIPLITPPINLMYLAQPLIDKGHEARIIDAYLDNLSEEEIVAELKRYDPNVVCISLYSNDLTVTYNLVKKISEALPHMKIVFGGHHPTHLPEITFKEFPQIDYVVRGEGEFSTPELIEALAEEEKGKDIKNILKDIRGISFRVGEKVQNNPDAPIIENLDHIPIPSRDLIKRGKYYSKMFRKNPLDVIVTTRGCPFSCIFCTKLGSGFKNYRMRSPENVMQEIRMISETGAKSLDIYDETFTIDHARCFKILDMMKQEGIDMELRVRTRVNVVNKGLLDKLFKHDCSTISYGVESGSQEVLDINKKGTTLDMIRKAFAITRKSRINILAFFLVGLIGDTPDSVQQTINFAKEIKPDYATFGHVLPYPGTEMYDRALKEGTLVGEWGINKPMPWVRLPWLTSKQQALDLVGKAYKQFYYRPGFVANFFLRCLKQRNWNQMMYTVKNAFTDLRQVNSVVVDESDLGEKEENKLAQNG